MNNSEFQIRDCKRLDLGDVVHIEQACFGAVNALPLISFAQYLELFSPAFIVIEHHASILGFAIGGVQLGNNYKSGWILDIAVLPHFQRKGVGKTLCTHIIDRLCSFGITSIKATVAPNNKASVAMLNKANFIFLEESPDYFGHGHRRLIMEYVIRETHDARLHN